VTGDNKNDKHVKGGNVKIGSWKNN